MIVIDFQAAMAENTVAVTKMLDRLLPPIDALEGRLVEAMRYSALNGGKRVRPFMVVSSAQLFKVGSQSALRTAAAIELVHCYSLVHDDLPAMDNDDLRRGQPTCHVKFDEATAILAGDAMLTRAFEVLVDPETHADPRVCCELVARLAQASGVNGMCGGQMLDLMAETNSLDMAAVTRLQRLKTGALIEFSCEAGAILGKASEPARAALRAYAHDVGLAFQIVDDLLDVEGDPAAVGKKTGKDAAAGKATFVSLLGVERARSQAEMLIDQAVRHLEMFREAAEPLRELARFVFYRRS